MRILLSAYACEPNKGSEPGVGWHWALEIEKLGHKVWVLTRSNNQAVIVNYFSMHEKPKNLHFYYYDLPEWTKRWKKGGCGIHLYYVLWQWGAYIHAKKIHKKIAFELIHHITFGVVRHPSFMGNLNIPFVFGPVGGGERCPWKLRKGFGIKGLTIDILRDFFNILVKFDPFMWLTFYQANKIYVKTPETKIVIPRIFWKKTFVSLEIGVDPKEPQHQHLPNADKSTTIRFLYVGRFIYWKGMHLGLSVFSNVIKESPSATLTLVGQGQDEVRWKKHAEKLGISNNIMWIPWVSQKELFNIYNSHHMLLFPSLHDSSGNVLLEAMSHGLPVVCLNLGGPGMINDNSCGIKVEVGSLSQSEIIITLAEQIKSLLKSPKQLNNLKQKAIQVASGYKWNSVIYNIYHDLPVKAK